MKECERGLLRFEWELCCCLAIPCTCVACSGCQGCFRRLFRCLHRCTERGTGLSTVLGFLVKTNVRIELNEIELKNWVEELKMFWKAKSILCLRAFTRLVWKFKSGNKMEHLFWRAWESWSWRWQRMVARSWVTWVGCSWWVGCVLWLDCRRLLRSRCSLRWRFSWPCRISKFFFYFIFFSPVHNSLFQNFLTETDSVGGREKKY